MRSGKLLDQFPASASLSDGIFFAMTYPVSDITGSDIAQRLKSVGIRTTDGLLDAAKGPKERKLLSEKTGLDEKRILSWANMADRMRIKGVGADYAGLLQAAGV